MDNLVGRLGRRLKLLTVANPKILKGLQSGYATAVLHLAPAWSSGRNTCANHTTECAEACLYFAGRGAFDKVQQARLNRTQQFFLNRSQFMDWLLLDVARFCVNAREAGFEPAVRLNGTSDIRWENEGIMQDCPHVQFYDYTKIVNRKNLPPNYHLTFSFSGNNLKECREALANGMSVAVPFLKGLPATWLGYPVVDGDADDLRFLQSAACVVGLKAKGPLRKLPQSPFLGDNHDV